MKILYIINGLGFSQNTGIGGSDKRAVEIIRNLKTLDPQGSYDILTTISGHKIFTEDEGLETKYYVIDIPSWWPKNINKYLIGRILSYFYAFVYSLINYKDYAGYDIYFASSDFYFDIIPCWLYAKKHNKILVNMVHHHITSPWSRGGSLLNNTLLFFSQRFSFWFIKKTTQALFLYDTPEGRKITKILYGKKEPSVPIYYVKNGINKKRIDEATQPEKEYEACFLGGIRHSKGIEEFVPIWKKVTDKFPGAKFLVIGGGSQEIINELKEDVRSNKLQENIIMTGPLSGSELFEKVKSAKIFLFPSHEEGWGIALCEAMYCGLPIVCYDLPAFKVFGEIVDKYPLAEYEKLAQKTIDYLSDESQIEQKREKLVDIALQFTWASIAEDEKEIFEKILSQN